MSLQDIPKAVEASGMGNNKEYKIKEAAIHFSRMWGVMETLGKLPRCDVSKFPEIMLLWAEEFVSENKDELVVFFNKKMEEIG